MTVIRSTVLLGAFAILVSLAAAQNSNYPDPYREIGNWARLPEGKMWGVVYGLGIDSHGNLWVLDRCGGDSCGDSNEPAIFEFDPSGKFIKSFGQGLFGVPHDLFVDKQDNIWVGDAGVAGGKGNQVTKLSPDGKVLLQLGKKGVMGGGPENFVGVSAIAVAPNGDIYVVDGHAVVPESGGSAYAAKDGPGDITHSRVAKFSKDGKFIKAWGKLGSGPGEFREPHGIALDSQGRVFVGDRGNNRVQIFDQDGKLLDIWKQFGKPDGIYIDANDNLYSADCDSNADLWSLKYSSINAPCPTCLTRVPRLVDVGLDNQDFAQGVRIGSVRDGVVKSYIPPHIGPQGPWTVPEKVAADGKGNVYVVDGRNLPLTKYVKKVELPEGPGKQLVERACASCHDFDEFPRVSFDREDWDTVVKTMVGGGAALRKEEIPAVVDYLATNFKPGIVPGISIPGAVQATITEWDVPTPNSMPYGIARSKRSGAVMYTAPFANAMGQFDPKTQQFQEYHLRPGTNPSTVLDFPHSNYTGVMFFAPQAGDFIGQFHPANGPYPFWRQGDVLEHPVPGPKLLLNDIAVGKRGQFVWFTATEARPPLFPQGSKIGRLSLWPIEIRVVDTLTPNADPYNIVVNSKQVPFFTERNSPRLGSIDPFTMQITEYVLPNAGSEPRGIAVTPDDVIWYTDYRRGYLGRFDPKTGKFSEWASPSGARSRPWGITNIGNAIWYAEAGTKPNMLVRFDPRTEKFQSWPVKAGGGIRHLTTDAEGNLWFTRPLANGIGQVSIKEEAALIAVGR